MASENSRYKLKGSRVKGERIDRILLSGSSSAPEHYIEVNGDSVEMSDSQYERLSKRYVLHKTSGPPASSSSSSEKTEKAQ